MSVPRYYAEYRSEEPRADGLAGRWPAAWKIFDRQYLSPGGETLVIAPCISRVVAFKIRDALNALEKT